MLLWLWPRVNIRLSSIDLEALCLDKFKTHLSHTHEVTAMEPITNISDLTLGYTFLTWFITTHHVVSHLNSPTERIPFDDTPGRHTTRISDTYPRRHSVCHDAIIQHLHDVFSLMISIAPLAFRPWDIPMDVSGRSRFPFDLSPTSGFQR